MPIVRSFEWASKFKKVEQLSDSVERLFVGIRHVDDLLPDINAIIPVDGADLIQRHDIRTMDPHKATGRQHLFHGLHRHVGDKRTGLPFQIDHHVILQARHV